MKNTGKTIDEFYKNIPIVNFPKKTKILILKIHKSILIRPTVVKCIEIAWRIYISRALDCDILLAVNEGLIEDIFYLDDIKKRKKGNNRKKLYVTQITDKYLRKIFVNHLIPKSYRKRRHTNPIRYNYKIEKGKTIFY